MLQSSLLTKSTSEKKHFLPFEIRISFLKCFCKFHFGKFWWCTNVLQIGKGDWIPIRCLINKATVSTREREDSLLENRYLFNFQLLLSRDEQLQEGIITIPNSPSLPCKLWGIPRILRIQSSKSSFQGRIIFPQFLRFDRVLGDWIPIWWLNTSREGVQSMRGKSIGVKSKFYLVNSQLLFCFLEQL